MSLKKFLGNWIVKNLLLGGLMVAAVLIVVGLYLRIATQHNKEITVPDFSNLTYAQAVDGASLIGVRVQISDSVYVRKARRGVVLSQNPEPGAHVKKGRRIFLTVNASSPMKVTMPDVRKITLRQAKTELSANNLTLGRIIYVHDISSNRVLAQLYRGLAVRPGTKLNAGSAIDLRVSTNGSEFAWMPDVVGQKYQRAVDLVQENYMNIGTLQFDKSVRTYADSLSAVVYSQSPGPSEGPFALGSNASLYLTLDRSKSNGR